MTSLVPSSEVSRYPGMFSLLLSWAFSLTGELVVSVELSVPLPQPLGNHAMLTLDGVHRSPSWVGLPEALTLHAYILPICSARVYSWSEPKGHE